MPRATTTRTTRKQPKWKRWRRKSWPGWASPIPTALRRPEHGNQRPTTPAKETIMTTWAADAFGNDYALDSVQDLQETSSLEPLETSLDYVIDNGAANVEAPLAAEALAAADVLARLLGNPDPAPDGPAS